MGTIRTVGREEPLLGMRPFSMLAMMLGVWYRRRRQRLDLSRLDRHLLDDIGLTAERAMTEARKPFWRA
jgi:uncharacterized protein YjiS (DUF1127 family)